MSLSNVPSVGSLPNAKAYGEAAVPNSSRGSSSARAIKRVDKSGTPQRARTEKVSKRASNAPSEGHAASPRTASTQMKGLPKQATHKAKVMLNVYDLNACYCAPGVNTMLKPMGYGLFHCGVEVYGLESSFSFIPDAQDPNHTGIFLCEPRCCDEHTFKEAVDMGRTSFTEVEVIRILKHMQGQWPSSSYKTLSNNCHHFCNAFLQELGCRSVPQWVMSLPRSVMDMQAEAESKHLNLMCCTENFDD